MSDLQSVAATMRRRQLLAGLAAGGTLMAGTRQTIADSAGGVCTFGVLPYLPALTIERLFAPVAAELGTILATDIQLKSKASFEAFVEELARGTYDVALLHPFLYVEASARQGYLPLARVDQKMRAVLLGRDIGPTAYLNRFRGLTLALPPRLAGVSYLVIDALIDAGLRPGADVFLRHYPDKVSCLHAVATGEAAACAVPSFLLGQLGSIRGMQLAPVWQSSPTVSLGFAAHPRLPSAKRAMLLKAMLIWPATETGKALLAALDWPRLVPARDADYASIRALGSRLSTYAAW